MSCGDCPRPPWVHTTQPDLALEKNMSVWHMLNICLIYVKTKLKKPWQPTVVFCYKKNDNGTTFFGDRVRRYCSQGQAYLTLFWHKINSLSLRYGRDMIKLLYKQPRKNIYGTCGIQLQRKKGMITVLPIPG